MSDYKTTTPVVQITEDSWPEAVSDGLTLACPYCDTVPNIDYRVSDEAWRRVIDETDRLGVVCLECYLAGGGRPSDIEEIQVVRSGETLVAQPNTVYRYGAESTDDDCPGSRIADEIERMRRAESVDPSEVRVGDVVEIEADDGAWMVRAKVESADSDSYTYPFAFMVRSLGGDVIWPNATDITVRVLQRAEPEPDPAAVEALYQVHEAASEAVTDEGSNTYRTDDLIRELVRRGVQVVSRDA